ncbi:Pyridoxamine 5'-phosphate oxidase-related, FMN-binding protein [Parvularcula bermudensis HTCC2503]|uniref:Pyridoxamine 5'-phosphate oxidase-related, FMN-binding protein n=1 Tax=Parvularcula bermudensis (strain ATCC BAA-594 / HTCC2503 / KCTC 12087) TaxID=314260 RepID=E0TEJ8_PARBH|nr:pyridoxamine 5'-phosphate oxidase family protein [Parvularcula bermudensis]ADM10470.1 Pyridoxamine 5'-phosphate oxidase-related, FMN-binding protein [Parvularcula bermudensis HTCC2503]
MTEHDLPSLYDHLWARLERATFEGKDPWRWPMLATASPAGGPAGRIVVLRKISRAETTLTIYTDTRSEKVHQIEAIARAALVFFDPTSMEQLRATGTVSLLKEGDRWRSLWDEIREGQDTDYRRRSAPGTPIPSPSAAASTPDGPPHFAVIDLHVDHFDWLSIDRDGHRRAHLFPSTGKRQATWVVP